MRKTVEDEARPGFRVDDYAGAFAGLAAGSAMLWVGQTGPAAAAGAAPASFVGGGLVAALALTFAGSDILDASPGARCSIRWSYAAALLLAGGIAFSAGHAFGAFLVAVGCGVAALPANRRALSVAVGVWCLSIAPVTARWPQALPLDAAALRAIPFGHPGLVAIALTQLIPAKRVRQIGIVALTVAAGYLILASVAHGILVPPFVVLPGLCALAAGSFFEGEIVWPRSLRTVLARRIAFAAFAALWVWASSAALMITHEALANAADISSDTLSRADLQISTVTRSVNALGTVAEDGKPRRAFEVLRHMRIPVLWVACVRADGGVCKRWPEAVAIHASGEAQAAVSATARRALRAHGAAVSAFFVPSAGAGAAFAGAQPLAGRPNEAMVAVYDIDRVMQMIAALNVTPSIAVRLQDGHPETVDAYAPQPPSSRLDLVTTRRIDLPGADRPWRLIAASSGVALLRWIEVRLALVVLLMLLATAIIVVMSARFADGVARPIREIRERAMRLAHGESFDAVPANTTELSALVDTLVGVGDVIRGRDHALTLAHELTLGTFGLRQPERARAMAEAAVDAYFGVTGCARIAHAGAEAITGGAALAWPRPKGATTVIRYPLRAARSALEVRLSATISDDDLTSLALLADTADLAIGASALLRTLGEERGLLDQIYASVPVGIVLVDRAGGAAMANDAARSLLEIQPQATLERRLTEMLGVEELHDGRILVGERQRPVEVQVRPTIDGVRSLVVLRDLTEQEALEGLKSEFIAAVSHDLRTPLAAIKGFAVLLQERDDLHGEVREILLMIDRAANRLTRMIDDLMQSALLESGRLMLAVEPIPLQAAVRNLNLLEAESPLHQLVIEAPGGLAVIADRDRLEQALVNLVSNAYKYAPSGRVLVRARAMGDSVEIAVSDDGPGIPQEEQGRIFEKFYQAPISGKRRRGVGLGLYISRELIERMGGSLSVRSVPGFGATFVISLRAAKCAARAEHSA
ncbi:MAG: HAMP domain-containing histidine kinase [bacterium]|nr:HAMP domain-containing histidine kinase [bacterium]